jgi:hypothetical protein
MKEIIRNSTHTSSNSHDCLIVQIKNKKVKITYQSYNAVERCNTEFFDGDKWNHILSMLDMGIEPNTSTFLWGAQERKSRTDELFKKAKTMCNAIL